MKVLVLTISFIFSTVILSQEVKSPAVLDTSKFEINVNSFSQKEIKYELIDVNKFIIADIDLLKLQLKTIPISFVEENKFGFEGKNILNPLYNQYMQDQKYAIWKSILGGMQLGAVGYLAYKHIKKYGFK
jgi:hypothetical protein